MSFSEPISEYRGVVLIRTVAQVLSARVVVAVELGVLLYQTFFENLYTGHFY